MRRLLLAALPVALIAGAAVWMARSAAGPPPDLAWTQVEEVTTLDPARMTAVGDSRIAGALLEGLTVIDPEDLAPKPGVAERWEVSPDGLVYTFHLRPDARWSDGQPVTSDDFVFAWRRVLAPKTAAEYVYMLWPIRGAKACYDALADGRPVDWADVGVRASGPHTLVVELERPTAYFLSLAAFMTYLPLRRDNVLAPDGTERERWTFPPNFITNGQYRLSVWHFRQRMVLERNPHYWDAASVSLGRIEARVYGDAHTALLAYETGAIDLTTDVPAIVKQPLLAEARQGRRDDVQAGTNLGTYFYRFNCTRPPLDDARVRRALVLAIDREALVERGARGGQTPAFTLVPPGMAGYASPPGMTEDVEEARRLLAEAGYPGGAGLPEMAILVNKGGGHVPVAELVQQQWHDRLGFDVRIEQVEWKVLLQRVTDLDYQIARAGWFGDYLDPNTFIDMFVADGGNNRTGWSSERYDALVEQAARELDPEARMHALEEAEAILLDAAPIVPIYYYTSLMLVRPALAGVRPNLLNRIDFGRVRWARP